VIAIGRRKTQLDRAEAMGAHELVRADQHANTVEAVRNLTGGPRSRHRRGSGG
jgi:Zn-dependent alcohol dehydrogenase